MGPLTLVFSSARWYPEEMSKYWFKAFMPEMPEFSIIWIVLIPLACFVAHSVSIQED